MLNKKSVDDINVKGQRVLVRCDFNVPLKEGKITDENRLVDYQNFLDRKLNLQQTLKLLVLMPKQQ